jgi:hypothetical protein
MKYPFWIVVLVMTTSQSVAQFQKIKTVNLERTVTYAAVDRPGDLYLMSEDGTLEIYNDAGVRQKSGKLGFVPTTFDPRDGSRLFAADSRTNQFMFFSPYDFDGEVQRVDSAFAISPVLTSSSGDHDLLTIDSADWSLKKVNLKTNRVLFETVLGEKISSLPELKSMREYQNFVFILDGSQGIYIFNMIGNLLKFLPAKGLIYLGFLGEELYYLQDEELVFFDLFTTETREVKIPYPADYAFLTDQRLYLIREKKLEVFSLKP